MSYIKNIPSLQERASLEVALNLCQDSNFKATTLCLERPTYGEFYYKRNLPIFVRSPKNSSLLENETSDALNERSVFFGFSEYKSTRKQDKPLFVNENRVSNWFAAVNQQHQKLIEHLPQSLKIWICTWINQIALEYLSYGRRLEVLFGVSRYIFMNFVTRDDWTETCRLDEKKIAKRLLKDVRLSDSQRYRIACVYCLVDDIPRLWKRLTEKEKKDLSHNKEPTMPMETNRLVRFWSLVRERDKDFAAIQMNTIPWPEVLHGLVAFGNVAILMPLWKMVEEKVRYNMVIDLTIKSVGYWHSINSSLCYNMEDLWNEGLSSIEHYNLISYYGELILFFLSEMNEDQQLLFFQKAVTEFNFLICFLHWPLCDYFLSTINRLWKILRMEHYKKCLSVLASLYSENNNINLTFECSKYFDFYSGKISKSLPFGEKLHYCKSQYEKVNRHYDYRCLLWKLWEETPQEYKSYVFSHPMYNRNGGNTSFLILLSERSPFNEKDEALFKLIFRDLPEADRKSIICYNDGEICLLLLKKEKYSFATWLLQQCLVEDEIPYLRKQFIKSNSGRKLCFYKLQENCEDSLLDLLDWSFDLDSEKTQFKRELCYEKSCVSECKLFVSVGNFTEVERIMNFCLASDELKEEFKFRCVTETYETLLNDCKWELLDKAFTWGLKTEKRIKEFKETCFTAKGCNIFLQFIVQDKWEDVMQFYKFFDLSREEIINLKYNVVQNCFDFMKDALYRDTDIMSFFVEPLRWCLTDEEMIINFKNDVLKEYV